MQVGRTTDGGIPVCRDSDDISFGNFTVAIGDSRPKEQYRPIDLWTLLAKGMKDTLPVYDYFHLYGWKVIHWFTAVMGCDISVNGNGIDGMGRVAFVRALRESEDEDVRELEPFKFANKLRNLCRPAYQLKHTIKSISLEMKKVEGWYAADGTYYNSAANLYLVPGSLVVKTNPKTGAEYSAAARQKTEAASPHNLLPK